MAEEFNPTTAASPDVVADVPTDGSMPSAGELPAAHLEPVNAELAEPEFVTPEAVPDPPSPFAFGIKAMLALTAIAGVQFTLMRLLTPMGGLVVGIAFCALAMTGIMIAAVVMGLKPGSSLMEQLDRVAIRLVFAIIILFFGSIIAGGGVVLFTVLEDTQLSWRTQQRLGFAYEEQTMWGGNGAVTVLEITKVEPGGALGLAGVQVGDAIVLDDTRMAFFEMLEGQGGKTVNINVARGMASSASQSLANATIESVTVQVP